MKKKTKPQAAKPGNWRVSPEVIDTGNMVKIIDGAGNIGCVAVFGDTPKEARARAALIVRAVNAHGKFIAAIKSVWANWESGDLAGAVRELSAVLYAAEEV